MDHHPASTVMLFLLPRAFSALGHEDINNIDIIDVIYDNVPEGPRVPRRMRVALSKRCLDIPLAPWAVRV